MKNKNLIALLLPLCLMGCDASANPLMEKSVDELEQVLGNAQARSCFFVVDGSSASNEFHKNQCNTYVEKVGYSKEDIADKALREHWQALKVEAKCEKDINKVKQLGHDKLQRWSKSGVGKQCQPYIDKYGK